MNLYIYIYIQSDGICLIILAFTFHFRVESLLSLTSTFPTHKRWSINVFVLLSELPVDSRSTPENRDSKTPNPEIQYLSSDMAIEQCDWANYQIYCFTPEAIFQTLKPTKLHIGIGVSVVNFLGSIFIQNLKCQNGTGPFVR